MIEEFTQKFYDKADRDPRYARAFGVFILIISPYMIVRTVWEECGQDIKEFFGDIYKTLKEGKLP